MSSTATTTTAIWIRREAIQKALGLNNVEVPAGVYQWVRASVLSGDVSSSIDASTVLVVVVNKEDYESHEEWMDQRIEISGEILLNSGGGTSEASIVRANEWNHTDASSESSSLPPDDLITLTHLHEPSLVHCLKRRYSRDVIYTLTGPILIALNPFKELPGLYDDALMSKFFERGEEIDSSHNLQPHVYGTADAAFRRMMHAMLFGKSDDIREEKKDADADDDADHNNHRSSFYKNQSILVSGESGSGKTVTTKHLMKYLATLSARRARHGTRRRAPSPGRAEQRNTPMRRMSRQESRRVSRMQSWKAGALIEEKILESNPILEAFGNARTVRNDNSSRFGKFIQLQFKVTGSLIGASIETYLLEKVRLLHQQPGERNFHVFYEMLAAATEGERKDYLLQGYTVEDFAMTNMSGTYTRRDGVEDAALFDELVLAMGTMGITASTQEDIFSVCVACLHASNLTFEAITDDSSRVDRSNPHLKPFLELLGLEFEAFQSALCEFDIEAGHASYTRQLNKDLAAKGLEALVKATYGAMFSYIVQSINKNIRGAHKGKTAYIGVLDIFGFEIFQRNSFEQLCINYCNEALQQQFNRFMFKTEQELYQREGIEWEYIEFPDNQDVIDLIDKKRVGIISILTDHCRTPRATDGLFADAMYKACGDHSRFVASDLQRAEKQFLIQHYAGPVLYETEGFLEKNKDEIPRGATNLLESSSKSFVQLLGQISAVPSSTSVTSSGRPQKRPTVGSQFAMQLGELRRRIDSTDPHYIRCLKPNQDLKPDDFEDHIVADQLRCAGVLEAIRVSRAGYPQRYSHEQLLEHYHFMVGKAGDMQVDDLLLSIARNIWAIEHPDEEVPTDLLGAAGIQKGETKVFLRQGAFDCMERVRTKALYASARKIQSVVRAFLARKNYLQIQRHIILAEACARRFLAKKYLRHFRELKAATSIQKTFRMSLVRHEYTKKKLVASWCQRTERGRLGREQYRRVFEQRRAEQAQAKLEYDSAVCIQNMYRGMVARKYFLLLQQQKAESALKPKASIEVAALRQKQQRAAIAAERAAAVAKENAYSKDKEVEELRRQLEEMTMVAGQLETSKLEVEALKRELAIVEEELELSEAREELARSRVCDLEAENRKLKMLARDRDSAASTNAVGISEDYDEYPDLKQLDERIHGVFKKSKQGKKELEALVQSLAILRKVDC